MDEDISLIRAEYDVLALVATRLLNSLREQIATVVEQNDIALAVPIETRVKSWDSIREKLTRKGRKTEGLAGITDFAGIRLIALFQRDVEKLDQLIRSMLDIIESEDTSSRLDDAHFGYRSNHYVGRIPETWQSIPSYRGLGQLTAEIQVRTLPQHMWAAASHKLQYKREDSAPPRLRRAINRVAAILETVDLEFSRILDERDNYVQEEAKSPAHDAALNVDNIAALMAEIFPAENLSEDEDYDNLLGDVNAVGIVNVEELRKLLEKGKESAIKSEKDRVKLELAGIEIPKSSRLKRGVFFTHTGLAREALRASHGPLPGDHDSPLKMRPGRPKHALVEKKTLIIMPLWKLSPNRCPGNALQGQILSAIRA